MDWVREFYSTTGTWWAGAEAVVGDRERRRVATVVRLGRGRDVLELGCGYGNTAVALARAGYRVTGVDISDRIDAADRLREPGGVFPRLVKEDFYAVDLPERYDVVCYWNGFGVGTDADQRRLLRRIADEWLRRGGAALVDVMNPLVWAGWAGDVEERPADPARGYSYSLRERTDFDPVHSRYTNTWWRVDQPERTYTQTGRCYSPADLRLLLEGTGLGLAGVEVGGRRLDLDRPHAGDSGLLAEAHEYLAVLTAA